MLESRDAARRRAWRRAGMDPRVLQLGFALLLCISLLSGVPMDGWGVVTPPAQLSLALGLISVLVVFAITPRVRNPRWLLVGMSFGAMLTLGISALKLDVGTLPLVVLPALALARALRWWSVPVSGVGTALLISLPAVVANGNEDGTVSQVLPLPFVAMLSASAIAVWLDIAWAARDRERAALAEVERHRRTMDAFVATVDVALQLYDTDGTVVLDNPRMRELIDLKWPDGRRDGVGHLFGPDGSTPLPADEQPSNRAMRGEELDDVRIWLGENPAVRRALSVSARNILDEGGRRTGTAMAYQDVTDLMRALAVKDEFIGLVSHELRTPLTSIYGYVSLLQERDDLPNQAVRHLDVVGRSTDRLRVLVNDLIDATQVAGTGLQLQRKPCDLALLVRDAVQSARPHAERAGVDLQVHGPTDEPVRAVVDRIRVAQVLDNLISNAIKYTPSGGSADVRLSSTADHAEISVRDSGIGIRAEDQGRVFGQFFRTREASERAIQGAGLGLAITRSIVEAHGGRIELCSRPGEGSRFTVTLPLGPTGRTAS